MKKLLFILALILASCGNDGAQDHQQIDNMHEISQLQIKSTNSDLVEFEGQLFDSSAIGGENTGYSLSLGAKPSIELDLATNNLQKKFSEYLFVRLKGHWKTVEGVEIPERLVFEVKDLWIPDDPHIE